MADDFFLRHLAHVPVVAILRGQSPEATVSIAQRCWDAGIRLVEVPSQGIEGLRALEAAAVAAQERGTFVGAGTVFSVVDAQSATNAGAAFLVGPGLDEKTVEHATGLDIPYLPGVTTPTEVQRALALGVRTAKLFPAAPLGPSWVSALHGPFPEMGFIAVGGITAQNAAEFIGAGALAVGAGGAFSDPEAIARFAALKPSTKIH